MLVSVDISAATAWASAREDLAAFRDRLDAPWTFALDTTAAFLLDYRAGVTPTLLVIDPEGRLHARFEGAEGTLDALQAAVDGARAAAGGT